MKPSVPIPALMDNLTRDPRGFPVPWIVLIDKAGTKHFVINDTMKVLKCATDNLCGVCGNPMEPIRMYVGGVRNAFHRRGSYNDPPMHTECAHYALQVCPFLAMPNYRGADIDAHVNRVEGGGGFRVNTVTPGKPVMFVAVLANPEKPRMADGHIFFNPKRPYRRVEYWRDGVKLSWNEGRAIRDQVMAREIAPTVE